MPSLALPQISPSRRLWAPIAGAVALALGVALVAQVSGDRGIAPVASTTDIEVRGITVDVVGKNSEDARLKGWQEAKKLAWKKIGGPDIPESQLEGLISAIVVEREQLGPRRYIATLGVVFDRARSGGLLGGQGERARSAPMLTLPVLITGGTQTVFEVRNPWQRAWAEYQAGASAIDYVRPSGAGSDSLVLNFGQTGRRSRLLWNDLLDQFGAADVIVPIARLEYSYPGGPVLGHFTGRHGPDNEYLFSFTLRARDAEQVPAMLTMAVEKFDEFYSRALAAGILRPDPTLSMEGMQLSPEVRALIEAARQAELAGAAGGEGQNALVDPTNPAATPAAGEAPVVNITVQVTTPDAPSVDAAIAALRGTPGVRGVSTSSVAIGGTSVTRVSFAGDLATLADALRARGWQVTQGNNALAITR